MTGNISFNMELIILFSLLTASASSTSLDADPCGIGESFWCQSLANAEACSAVDHCKETVWKNMQLDEELILSKASLTEKCRVCQKFFLSTQARLKTNDTQASILKVLRSEICPLISATNTDMCLRAVGSTLPLILEMFSQFDNHRTICQQLTMCSLAEDGLDQHDNGWNMLHSSLNKDQNNTIKCGTCMAIIEIITTKINISGVIEETILTYFCRDTYFFPMLCKGIVKLLVPQIVNNLRLWLINYNICKEFHFCVDSDNSASLSMHEDLEQRLATSKPTICQLCLQTFKATVEGKVANKTETTLLKAMRLVCDSLWWPHGNHCHKMVEAVGRPALEKLSQRLHPEGVCQMLDFCEGASVIDLISESINNVASERCSYCQSTSEYLAVLLRHGRAVNVVQSNVKRICEFRPFGMDDEECEFVVDKYTPVLVDYLIDDLSQDNVCQMEPFCGR